MFAKLPTPPERGKLNWRTAVITVIGIVVLIVVLALLAEAYLPALKDQPAGIGY